jgi:hypothetical protein
VKRGGKRSFGVMGTRAYTKVVIALCVLIAIELPAAHFIVQAAMEAGWARSATQGVLAAMSGSVLVWLWRDLQALRRSEGVVLEGKTLQLDMGRRAQGELNLRDLRSASTYVPEDEGEERILRATPYQEPNVLLRFRRSQRFTGVMGAQFEGKLVAVYVDEPDALLDELGRR